MLPDAVRNLVLEGESETVEFKRSVPPSRIIARIIAGLANARGGVLLLGVEDHPSARLTGVDADMAEAAVWRAVESLSPSPEVLVSRVMLDAVEVVAVEVGATPQLTLAPDGLFKRVGDSVRPFTPDEAVARLANDPTPVATQDAAALAQAVALLTKQLDDQTPLLNSLIKANHWTRKGFWMVLGAAAGAGAKVLVSLVSG